MEQNPNNTAYIVLQEINEKHIKLKGEAISECNQIIKFVKNVMIEQMCQVDPLFNAIFQRVYHTGSFYDGLKVGEPEEYDLNLVLEPKLPKGTFEIVHDSTCHPGFMFFQIDDPKKIIPKQHRLYDVIENFKKLLTSHGKKYYIEPKLLRSWIQGILDKTVKLVEKRFRQYGLSNVSKKTTGPALTLHFKTINARQIDVDLVPVFSFNTEQLKNYPSAIQDLKWLNRHKPDFKEKIITAMTEKDFMLVPKPRKLQDRIYICTPQFRIDFHDVEKEILKEKGCAKLVLKLLKYFRDCNQPINKIFSYALKTIVMEMIRNNPYDEWNDKQLAHHFLKTLKILNRKLEDGKIEYFFEPNSNLLENKSMNLESIKSMALWLKNVIQKLENSMDEPYCRKVWMEYFQKPNKGFFSDDVIHSLHSITGIFSHSQ